MQTFATAAFAAVILFCAVVLWFHRIIVKKWSAVETRKAALEACIREWMDDVLSLPVLNGDILDLFEFYADSEQHELFAAYPECKKILSGADIIINDELTQAESRVKEAETGLEDALSAYNREIGAYPYKFIAKIFIFAPEDFLYEK